MNDQHVLPSNRQLIMATLAALIVAAIILVIVVLPAEYGIDKTGLGKTLGLTQMGEIKLQLANEETEGGQANNKAKPLPSQALLSTHAATSSSNVQTGIAQISWEPKTASRELSLKPGQAAEIKVGMKKDQVVNYEWFVDSGHVNFDVHADNANTKYFNYTKGKKATSDKGKITAAFDGKHGWFWRNRSTKTLTITLDVSGEFEGVFRVM